MIARGSTNKVFVLAVAYLLLLGSWCTALDAPFKGATAAPAQVSTDDFTADYLCFRSFRSSFELAAAPSPKVSDFSGAAQLRPPGDFLLAFVGDSQDHRLVNLMYRRNQAVSKVSLNIIKSTLTL